MRRERQQQHLGHAAVVRDEEEGTTAALEAAVARDEEGETAAALEAAAITVRDDQGAQDAHKTSGNHQTHW